MSVRTLLALILAVLLAGIVGCNRKQPVPERRYEVKGRVVSVDKEARQIMVEHEDIPGFMKAMTMPFRVKDDWVFDRAAPGDLIRATLVVGEQSHLEDVSLTKQSDTGTGSSGMRVPQAGDAVPDLSFVNQDGSRIRLRDLRGKTLVVTFIYTRCPLPDYCILMSNNFEEVAKKLKKDAQLYENTRLISISFDPEYDNPKVLREYGSRYASEVDPKFTHWQFVTGSPEDVKKAADFFGISYVREKDQFVHSLRTAVIGPDGKVVRLFPGNEWKPDEVVGAISGARL